LNKAEALRISLWLLIIIILTVGIGVKALLNRPTPKTVPISFKGVSKVYGGYRYVAIIRIDDFIVDQRFVSRIPDSLIYKSKYFINYEDLFIKWALKNEPDIPFVIGVITGCPTGNCSQYWNLYSELIRDYSWEVASHSRWHVRPPRDPNDYLGAIRDIESNITGYKVLTYILPFGRATKAEIKDVERNSCVRIVMTTTPFQLLIPTFSPNHITEVGFSVKLTDKLPWKPMLYLLGFLAEKFEGLLVIYTHVTSYDWREPTHLTIALSETISFLRGTEAWITTSRVLWLYENEAHLVKVYQINSTSFRISYNSSYLCNLRPIPVTLIFKISRGYKVLKVNAGDVTLKEYKRMPYVPGRAIVLKVNVFT
jgi:hypothetical protein